MKVGVVLAAGASSRMGSSKPLVKMKGESFLAHGIRNLWAVCDTVVVVLGAEAARVRRSTEEEFEKLVQSGSLHADLKAARRQGIEGLEVHFLHNRAWARGMFGSAQLGIAEALRVRPEGVVVLPVDHPHLSSATVRLLSAAMDAALGAYKGTRKERDGFAYAVVPRFDGERGHPLVLSPGLARRIVDDRDANDLSDAVRRNARLVGYLDVPDGGVIRNLNTPDDESTDGRAPRRRTARKAARPRRKKVVRRR
jgi:CTP:molybdopterin cytidylyltransferase MocA